jgi:hypothetical protein
LTIVPKILFNIFFFIIIILTRIEKKSIKTILKIAGGTQWQIQKILEVGAKKYYASKNKF